jgi:O-antigen/teichoic acid export membrane protein
MLSKLLHLSKHSLIYGLGILSSQLVGFFLLPIYTRYLTPADYGVLEIFGLTSGILRIIFGMGLGSALFMLYFHYEDNENKKTVVSTAFFFLTFTSLIFTLILIETAGNFSSVFFHTKIYTLYFKIIFLTLFFDTSILIPMSIFRAKEESKKYVVVSLMRFLMSVGLNIYFLVFLQKGVLGILASGLITTSILYLFLIPGIIKETKFRFSISDLKEMLRFGLPLIPGNLGTWILTVSDRYFLLFLTTSQELGLYSLGYKFGFVIHGFIVSPFSLAWGPFFWSMAKEKDAKKIFSSVLTYFVLIVMFVTLTISIFSKEILFIMATPSFYDAYKVIPLIALSYVLYGFYFILSAGLNLAKKTKYVPFIVGTGAILNLLLNYLLIPTYGMMGAAVATLVSYSVLPIGSYFVSNKFYHISYEWYRIFKIFIVAFLIYVISLFIAFDSIWISVLLKGLILFTYPILLYGLKFFRREEIQKSRELLQKKIFKHQ